jgi:hypothetical protein
MDRRRGAGMPSCDEREKLRRCESRTEGFLDTRMRSSSGGDESFSSSASSLSIESECLSLVGVTTLALVEGAVLAATVLALVALAEVTGTSRASRNLDDLNSDEPKMLWLPGMA